MVLYNLLVKLDELNDGHFKSPWYRYYLLNNLLNELGMMYFYMKQSVIDFVNQEWFKTLCYNAIKLRIEDQYIFKGSADISYERFV